MNWKKIALITILTLYGFGFSTVFGYTPLTPNQLKEIRTTLESQLTQKESAEGITPAELRTLNQELNNIKNELIAYQANPTRTNKAKLELVVFNIGFRNLGLLFKFHLPNYLKQWPDNLKDEKIVGDITKIEAEVNDILNKSPGNTNDL